MVEIQRELADLRRKLTELVSELTKPPQLWEARVRVFTAANQIARVTGPVALTAVILASGVEVEVYDLDTAPAAVGTLDAADLRLIVSTNYWGAPIRLRYGLVLRTVGAAADVAVVYRGLTEQESREGVDAD